jgi:hypothetical protein
MTLTGSGESASWVWMKPHFCGRTGSITRSTRPGWSTWEVNHTGVAALLGHTEQPINADFRSPLNTVSDRVMSYSAISQDRLVLDRRIRPALLTEPVHQ